MPVSAGPASTGHRQNSGSEQPANALRQPSAQPNLSLYLTVSTLLGDTLLGEWNARHQASG